MNFASKILTAALLAGALSACGSNDHTAARSGGDAALRSSDVILTGVDIRDSANKPVDYGASESELATVSRDL